MVAGIKEKSNAPKKFMTRSTGKPPIPTKTVLSESREIIPNTKGKDMI